MASGRIPIKYEWEIELFETSRGEKPVEDFIRSMESGSIAKIAHAIDLLKQHGSLLGMPHAKKVTNQLYELRIRGKQEIRILYAFSYRMIYLLHGFKKKQDKIPSKELHTAEVRLSYLTKI